jgi:hypothetical protein
MYALTKYSATSPPRANYYFLKKEVELLNLNVTIRLIFAC